MKNKIFIAVIIILLPISIFVGNKKEIKEETNNIKVLLNYNNDSILLDLDEYLIGVVGAEMPASFNYEALKAQAVASRSYILSKGINDIIETNTNEQAYQDNTKLKDKWQNEYDKYYNKIKDAVINTKDEVLIYNDKIIKSYYYAMSNGYTEDSLAVFNEEQPYYDVIDSTFDQDNNKFEVTTTINKNDFCNKLDIDCNNIIINDIKKDSSNRVSTITINNKVYTGIEIRKKLNLRSTDFTIDINDNIDITTKGYGHGVGMSQYGANYLAKEGKNYQDILKYYYKDIEIKKYNV